MVGIFTLVCMGLIGNMILIPVLATFAGFEIGPALSAGAGSTSSWMIPLYNTTLLLIGIGMTVYCASRPVEEVDYFSGLGGI